MLHLPRFNRRRWQLIPLSPRKCLGCLQRLLAGKEPAARDVVEVKEFDGVLSGEMHLEAAGLRQTLCR